MHAHYDLFANGRLIFNATYGQSGARPGLMAESSAICIEPSPLIA